MLCPFVVRHGIREIVRSSGTTACNASVDNEWQFPGNHKTRALHLVAEFHNLVQGNLSISDYYPKTKGMADAFADLGEVVHDRTLILNILCGLNKCLQYMTICPPFSNSNGPSLRSLRCAPSCPHRHQLQGAPLHQMGAHW